ncbi:MAG TPA: hypothetical protein GX499_06050 [Clostridiales bacterium]|jgi:hypothetical protein|nr:hypothetical protein [Clostridiales bacterium]
MSYDYEYERNYSCGCYDKRNDYYDYDQHGEWDSDYDYDYDGEYDYDDKGYGEYDEYKDYGKKKDYGDYGKQGHGDYDKFKHCEPNFKKCEKDRKDYLGKKVTQCKYFRTCECKFIEPEKKKKPVHKCPQKCPKCGKFHD